MALRSPLAASASSADATSEVHTLSSSSQSAADLSFHATPANQSGTLDLTREARLAWDHTFTQLPAYFGEATFNSWLAQLKFRELVSGRLVLTAPSRFIRDWILTHAAAKLLEMVREHTKAAFALDVIADPDVQKSATVVAPAAESLLSGDEEGEAPDFSQPVVGSRLEPKYTFDTFVVGKPNELAHAAARKVAESETVTFNPLFLYGGVGLGKTHLMLSLIHI